jgi:hypothetical protein
VTGIFTEPDDAATPLTPEEMRDLIQAHIADRRDLNAAEQENIARAQEWAMNGRRPDLLTEKFVKDHRLHIIVGESLCSELAGVLKVGTTALVVAMAETGLGPGSEVTLADPLAAMRDFSSDPSLCARASTANGASVTALDMQWHYLRLAERYVHHSCMPEWAGRLCCLWRDTLQDLEHNEQEIRQKLDWAAKLVLFDRVAARHGVPRNDWPWWNSIIQDLRTAVDCAESDYKHRSIPLNVLFGAATPVPAAAAEAKSRLAKRGFQWGDLDRLLELQSELYEVDMRFGRVNGVSIFRELDVKGVFRHRVHEVGSADEALHLPPRGNRAWLRGKLIRELAPLQSHRCDWSRIWNPASGEAFNLDEPFQQTLAEGFSE